MSSPLWQDDPPNLRLSDLFEWCASPTFATDVGVAASVPLLVVDLADCVKVSPRVAAKETLAMLPCVLVGRTDDSSKVTPFVASLFDIVLSSEDTCDARFAVAAGADIGSQILSLARRGASNPVASISLALLLRQFFGQELSACLVAESTTYSLLQAGEEFRRWRAQNPRREPSDNTERRVLATQVGGTLAIELTRPKRHNAFDARMRDALTEVLMSVDHATCERIVLSGRGSSFCSGGDLDEFGSNSDPAKAHLFRIAANPTLALARVASKLEADIKGACIGSGLEMASFAHKVAADGSARFSLPEVAMGLIPGAGGTVSIPNRIGRHRAAYLAISGATIHPKIALEWGLIDVLKSDVLR